jgi:hypothetical protein
MWKSGSSVTTWSGNNILFSGLDDQFSDLPNRIMPQFDKTNAGIILVNGVRHRLAPKHADRFALSDCQALSGGLGWHFRWALGAVASASRLH